MTPTSLYRVIARKSGDRRRCARCVWSAVVLVAGCIGWNVPVQASGGVACLMKPSMEVSVAAPVEGVIQDVNVDRGDWVSKGQVIVTLEASVEKAAVDLAKAKADAEATIKSAQAKIAFSTRKLERATDLYKSNSIARHELDEAQTEKVVAEMAHQEALENKRMAELEWQRATASLKLHTIYSPLSGVVVDRLLSPGELARQMPILKLAQINPLWIEVFAPLSLLGKLEPGMKAEVRPDGGTSSAYQAEITVVNRLVDSASGTFGVRLEMPNPENVLPAGLACTVYFPVEQ
ncbi:MAG: efflux RND transporter periplasmic adaptor subunit [Nitrospira sp.]|nr:efflux RND transporter periplasmic adaptor subunit [Nitrospira sp.]